MAGLLALLFLVVPLVELFVIIQVGQSLGVVPTIGLLLVMSVAGGWLMKREGAGALGRVRASLSRGSLPSKDLLDGFLILFGGALMLTPGFLTDVAGLALLLPPVRAVIRPVLVRRFAGRITAAVAGDRRRQVIDL